jgi:3-hydroxyisobutyrate dehydrogenase
MIGGEADVVTALNPLFSCMGKTVKHLGPAGSGQHTKMVNQILISTMMVGLVEGLLYGQKAGLNLEEVINTVSQGAARILKGNFVRPRDSWLAREPIFCRSF